MIRDIDEEEKYEIDTSAVDTVAGFLCNGFISAALRKIAIMFTTKM